MRIETLYDSGTARHQEDCHLIAPPFLVVADGVSPPYSRANPLMMVDGYSTGAVAARVVCSAFTVAFFPKSSSEILRAANFVFGSRQKEWGRPLHRPDLLAGATVVAAKLGNSVEIVQVGDAIALWRFKSGQIGATENLAYEHEAHLRRVFAQIRTRVGGDRDRAWDEYCPVRDASIREHANRPGEGNYSVLNGQPEVESLFQTREFQCEKVKELILCSDGLVPFESTRDSHRLAEQVFHFYDRGGLKKVLEETRKIERVVEASSHESHAEATAIAVCF